MSLYRRFPRRSLPAGRRGRPEARGAGGAELREAGGQGGHAHQAGAA